MDAQNRQDSNVAAKEGCETAPGASLSLPDQIGIETVGKLRESQLCPGGVCDALAELLGKCDAPSAIQVIKALQDAPSPDEDP